MEFDQTVLQVDLDILEENFTRMKNRTGGKILAVVKADAYGHGAVPVARFLQGKCDFFGTASLAEALQLRRAGIRTPILVLGRIPVSGFPYAVKEAIRPVIFTYEDALALSAEAVKQNVTAPFHFAVDTGLSRIGVQVSEESADLCAAIGKLPGLTAEGLFSHYATADFADLSRAKLQAQRYREFDAMLQKRGLHIPIRHLNNSAGILNFPGDYEMSRAGISMYGMYPSDEVDGNLLPVTPIHKWVTRVTYLKTLPAGREISYGGIFTTTRPTVVATLPVGYADGYRRTMVGKCHVLIRGQKAPVLGKICMDQIMVDVTDIPGVALDDEVVLMGRSGDEVITADLLGQWAGTFNYDICCGIHRRVPRVYIQKGKEILRVNNLLDP